MINNKTTHGTIRVKTLTSNSSGSDLSIRGFRLFDELSGGVFRGPWENSTNYRIDDVVSYKNNVLICVKDHTSDTFPRTHEWSVIKYPSQKVIDEHTNDKQNPHEVNKEQIGLPNIINAGLGTYPSTLSVDNLSYVTPRDVMLLLDRFIPTLGAGLVGLGNLDNFGSARSYNETIRNREDLFVTNMYVRGWIDHNRPVRSAYTAAGALAVSADKGNHAFAGSFNKSNSFSLRGWTAETSRRSIVFDSVISEDITGVPNAEYMRMLLEYKEYYGISFLVCPVPVVSENSDSVGSYSIDNFRTFNKIPGEYSYTSVCASSGRIYLGTYDGNIVSFNKNMSDMKVRNISSSPITVLGECSISGTTHIMCIAQNRVLIAVTSSLNNHYTSTEIIPERTLAIHNTCGIDSITGTFIWSYMGLSSINMGGYIEYRFERISRAYNSFRIVGNDLVYDRTMGMVHTSLRSVDPIAWGANSRWVNPEFVKAEVYNCLGVLVMDKTTAAMDTRSAGSSIRCARFFKVLEDGSTVLTPLPVSSVNAFSNVCLSAGNVLVHGHGHYGHRSGLGLHMVFMGTYHPSGIEIDSANRLYVYDERHVTPITSLVVPTEELPLAGNTTITDSGTIVCAYIQNIDSETNRIVVKRAETPVYNKFKIIDSSKYGNVVFS